MKQPSVIYQKEVGKIVSQIVSGYKPEKVILFGSLASGKINLNSDIDLLIIKETRDSYFDRVKKIASIIDTSFPTDIFVLTPQEFNKAVRDNRFFIVDEVLPKGRVVYEQAKIRRRH